MPAGTYYVGDLCYVLNDEWGDFCDKTIVDSRCLSGEMVLSNGVRFASYNTAYGDGIYTDADGKRYAVDAGLIGCVKVEDCDISNIKDLGHIVVFDTFFRTGVTKDGTIWFGDKIEIRTGEDDDGWCGDNDEEW
jgi:hypothetical protein